MNSDSQFELTPRGVVEKLRTLFSELSGDTPAGPHVVALTAPAMSGKSETVAKFLQELITRDAADVEHPEGFHWKALPMHDRDHTTLCLAKAYPRPIGRKPNFFWFATGAKFVSVEGAGVTGLANNPWMALGAQLADKEIGRFVALLTKVTEGGNALWRQRGPLARFAFSTGLQVLVAKGDEIGVSLPDFVQNFGETVNEVAQRILEASRQNRQHELREALESLNTLLGVGVFNALRVFARQREQKPTVLVLDDFDGFDPMVRAVFFSQFSSTDLERLLVVVTLRDGTAATEQFFKEVEHNSNFGKRRVTRIHLTSPPQNELFAALRQEFGEQLPQDALEYLYHQSGDGSPIVLREIIQVLHGWHGGETFFVDPSGCYSIGQNLASIKAHLFAPVQGDVVDMRTVAKRAFAFAFGDLDGEQKMLLAAAAFIGDRFPRDYLVRVLLGSRMSTVGDPTKSPEERILQLLRASPLIDTDEDGPRFKGPLARLAVLHLAEDLIATKRHDFFGAYVAHLTRPEGPSVGMDSSSIVALGNVVLALACRMPVFGPDGRSTVENRRLPPPRKGRSAFLDEVLAVAAKSLPPQFGASERDEQANNILIAAANRWHMTSVHSPIDDDADDNLWALHEILSQCDPAGDFALARANAAVLRLRVWMNAVSAAADQRRRRIEMAKRETKAARDCHAVPKQQGNWRLKLKAIELDLLAAEATLLHYKHSGRYGKQRIIDASGEDHARSVLDLISQAIEALGPTAANQVTLIDKIKEASLLTDPVAREALVNQLLKGLTPGGGSRPWPEAAQEEVDHLRLQAMERLVLLSRWFSPEEIKGLDVSAYRHELVTSLREVIARYALTPDAPIRVWALRRLGRILLDMSEIWHGNLTDTSIREQALEWAQESVKRLKDGQKLSPGPKIAIELIRSVERLAQISDHGAVLAELRALLSELGRTLPPSNRRSYVLSEAARVDRYVCQKEKGRWPGWLPTLWERFCQRDQKVSFLDAIFADFGDLLRPHDRRAVVRELFAMPELGGAEVLNRLIAAVKDRPFSVQDATIDILEGFSHVALATGLIAEASPPERDQLLAAIRDADDALHGSSARTLLAVVSLQVRLRTHATLPIIAHGDTVEAIDNGLEALWRDFDPMWTLSDGLYDQQAQQTLAELLKLISEALLLRAAQEKQHRKLHFFLRDKAKFWFKQLEERLGNTTTLQQRQEVWKSQVKFHREYGNLYDATMFANKIARSQRYERLGSELGSLLYQANDALMSRDRRDPHRDTRQLLEAIVKMETIRPSHLPAPEDLQIDVYRMRERLGAVLWQNVRSRQPRQTRDSIPLLPTAKALDRFASSTNGAKGLISDILELWASTPSEMVGPATMVVARVAELQPTGIALEDKLGRRYLLRDTFLPASFYNFLAARTVGLSGEALSRELGRAGLPDWIAVILLGEAEHQRYERDFGSAAPYALVTAKGKIYVETVLPCLLPMAHKRIVVGASNSAVAMFMPKSDLDLLGLSNGIFQRQVANTLLNVRRFAGVPMVSLPYKDSLGLDAGAKLKQELTDFAEAFWSDLSFVALDEQNSRAVFELSIGAPVDPRKERTARSMLAKAFPTVKRFSIIGGLDDDLGESQDEGDEGSNDDAEIDQSSSPVQEEASA